VDGDNVRESVDPHGRKIVKAMHTALRFRHGADFHRSAIQIARDTPNATKPIAPRYQIARTMRSRLAKPIARPARVVIGAMDAMSDAIK